MDVIVANALDFCTPAQESTNAGCRNQITPQAYASASALFEQCSHARHAVSM